MLSLIVFFLIDIEVEIRRLEFVLKICTPLHMCALNGLLIESKLWVMSVTLETMAEHPSTVNGRFKKPLPVAHRYNGPISETEVLPLS